MTTTFSIPKPASKSLSNRIVIEAKSQYLLADTVTPVSLYLRLRDQFSQPLLLESADYHSRENSYSFICLEPLATFKVQNREITVQTPNKLQRQKVTQKGQVATEMLRFARQFEVTGDTYALRFNGLFGHTNFDAVQYFDTLQFDQNKHTTDLPDIHYSFYRFLIVIHHFKDEMYVIENMPQGETPRIEEVMTLINSRNFATFDFKTIGEETSNLTNEAFKNLVTKGKEHCQRGDVFQIVFARQFAQKFQGDEFNVYRTLRSVNPSPYLFYFDYGNYKIFGSSPEAQLVIKNQKAEIHPIAGTYKRTGDDQQDTIEAQKLADDPKENAEHVMLVDLARNDLSRNTKNVEVTRFKEVQFFSHVIHLVSKVTGDLASEINSFNVFADTFPAGTLSGAPKYKALELINKYENQNRSFYGGAIGYFGLNGDINHAIVIRSFLSQKNTLFYQAGAGIVIASDEEKELQEVNNKLAALKRALVKAEEL